MGAIQIDMVNPELLAGAKNAVETCLAIRPGENVALVFDEPSREVATGLAYALAQQRARWTEYCVEDYAPRPLTGAPKEVLAGLEVADAGILCFQPLPGELGARKQIVGVVERRQIRYAHMVSVTPQIMREGMRGLYEGGPAERPLARSDALCDGTESLDEGRDFDHGYIRFVARLGEDEWIDQPAVLVESAGG